jgi:superfamily I DNA/RNA helicase
MNFSDYQLDIFKYIEETDFNLVVSATAGSGKTTTLLECLNRIPSKYRRKLCIAFNKSIAETLKQRVPSGVDVKTFHALGLSVIFSNTKGSKMDDKKVPNKIKEFFTANFIKIESKDRYKVSNDINKIIDGLRLELISEPTREDILNVMVRYDIDPLMIEEVDWALKIYPSVISDITSYDFVDMLFLPIYHKMKFPKYDFIAVDEVQDMSVIQRKLFMECLSPTGKFLCVGDPAQCLPPETKISMWGGDVKEIHDVKLGDEVVSCYASGLFYKNKVIGINNKEFDGNLYEIETASGKIIKSTPDHIFFAEFHRELSKTEKHFVYLMFKKGVGYRIGKSNFTSSDHSNFGLKYRTNTELCDNIWVLGLFDSDKEARLHEILWSLKYKIPTYVFNPRTESEVERYIRLKIFDLMTDVYEVEKLFSDFDLDESSTHYDKKATNRDTLIGNFLYQVKEKKDALTEDYFKNYNINRTVYRFNLDFSNDDVKDVLEKNGYYVEKYKNKNCYRFRKTFSTFNSTKEFEKTIQVVLSGFDLKILYKWDFFQQFVVKMKEFKAKMLREGMVLINDRGEPDVIKSIKKIPYKGRVIDIKMANVPNFVANGLVVHNCIYAFAGADVDSYRAVCNLPNTKELPLSISYRCGKNIVKYANKLVPTMEFYDKNPDGEVIHDGSVKNVKYGDVILCRTCVPIAKLACQFLREGKKVQIKGADIGKNLITLIKNTGEVYFSSLYASLDKKLKTIEKEVTKKNDFIDPKKSSKYQVMSEKISTIRVLAEDCKTIDELITKISAIFSDDDSKSGITLSTIHKFKGLEAENVFIIEPQLIPFPYYLDRVGALQQEQNLEYVAITRAINKLEYITDWTSFEKKPIKKFLSEEFPDEYELDRMERDE